MRRLLVLFVLLLITAQASFAYAVRVYDEYGNRIGTYRKEGDNFVLYDFYDNKVTDPSSLMKNAPSQRTLRECTRTFYDANMNPIGSFTTGLWGSNGKYYPRGIFIPVAHYPRNNPAIVRQSAHSIANTNPPSNIHYHTRARITW